MGEQPIFTCKAHVFHIDPKTKRSWIPASSSAINVSFFFDSTRSLYRIISVEGTKAVINSTITPNMTFTKTSQKFGQWSDVRANTVYGLGFPSEAELNKFIEKFQEVKEATKNISGTSPGKTAAGANTTNGSTAGAPSGLTNSASVSANASPVSGRSAVSSSTAASAIHNANAPTAFTNDHDKDVAKSDYGGTDGSISPSGTPISPALLKSALVTHQRSQSLSGLQPPADSPKHHQQAKIDKNSPGSNNNGSGSVAGAGAGAPTPAALIGPGSSATLPSQGSQQAHLPLGSVEAQLKYENDRLKLALAQSSANAKKWEVELATLKNNNARLTNALQESTANVEEWKRQLQAYKEENQRVKSRIVELEAGRGPPLIEGGVSGAELKREVASLRLKIDSLEAEIRLKDDEIRRLNAELRDLTLAGDKIKMVEEENSRLEASGDSARNQLEALTASHEVQRRLLESLSGQLLDKIRELTQIQREFTTALET